MNAAGWVLAGGQSSRMGRDKSLLELDGETLAARAVQSLGAVCAEVGIAGGAEDLARYARVVPDPRPGCGPLGGIVGALEVTKFEWNLFTAVDVPFVPVSAWRQLLLQAERTEAVGVMARVRERVHPLCAAYRRSARVALLGELEAGRWKVRAAVEAAGQVEYCDFTEAAWFQNLNTPEDFDQISQTF